MPANYWASGAITQLACAGIVNGFPDGAFAPNGPVTRAQFTKMLVLALGLHPVAGTRPFADVPAGAWFAPDVTAAKQAGILQGLTPTTFGPNLEVTREEMAVMVARALALKTTTATLEFSDASQIAAWALPGVKATVAAGLMQGFPDGRFAPGSNATRAQAAEVIASLLQRAGA